MFIQTGFNPRAHAGRDLLLFKIPFSTNVSIHAPTRGATLVAGTDYAIYAGFNPRAHAGRDVERVTSGRQG